MFFDWQLRLRSRQQPLHLRLAAQGQYRHKPGADDQAAGAFWAHHVGSDRIENCCIAGQRVVFAPQANLFAMSL